ncbi:MAG: DNA translocase FtsK, partial [Caldimicrobium sp.]
IKDETIKEERIEQVEKVAEGKEGFEGNQKEEEIKAVPLLPPPLDLLQEPPFSSHKIKPEELKERALLLKAKLREFGIEGEVTGINPGPVITVFEFKPAPGIKLSRILSLVDDLALGLSAKSVRIVAPIPGKNVIGIEISNVHREWVYLKEILSHENFKASPSPLTIALGKDISGKPVVTDLKKMPHLLIAGSTGSGKSIFIHSIILSIIYKSKPEEVRFLMVDPKRIELSVYDGIPYLLHPVVLEPKMATQALHWAVQEMERRYNLFEELSVRNLESYNEEFEEKLPYIVIIIDELADLMVISSREVETLLTRLAQMARAAGIHLIVATQRPSVDVITGLIKANFPARLSFQVTSKVDSRTILDTQGAERLLGAGDMLFMPPGTSHLERIHAPYVSEKEIKKVVEYLKSFGEPNYLADLKVEDTEEESADNNTFDDELYKEALNIAYQYGKISVSMLQRKLRIGYNRAARLVEKMEEEGIIGPSDGVRPRPVINPRKPL